TCAEVGEPDGEVAELRIMDDRRADGVHGQMTEQQLPAAIAPGPTAIRPTAPPQHDRNGCWPMAAGRPRLNFMDCPQP
ncbi:MAG: hypothetical protein ACOYO0_14670, partial [Sandarakinorhabdus sp.]